MASVDIWLQAASTAEYPQYRHRVWAGAEDEANARETVATSATFNEPWDISTADLDEATAHGRPVAARRLP